MIRYENNCDTVKTTDVIFVGPEAIRKMGTMMLVSAAESTIDMVRDSHEEYGSKASIDAAFQTINAQALEMLDDVVSELRYSLEQFLRSANITADVRRLEYAKEGRLEDILLDLDVKVAKPTV